MPSHVAQSAQACIFKKADHCFYVNKNRLWKVNDGKDLLMIYLLCIKKQFKVWLVSPMKYYFLKNDFSLFANQWSLKPVSAWCITKFFRNSTTFSVITYMYIQYIFKCNCLLTVDFLLYFYTINMTRYKLELRKIGPVLFIRTLN